MKSIYIFERNETMPKTSFVLSKKEGLELDYFPRYQRGNNKGKQYVVLRKTVLFSLKDKFPYCLNADKGKMITGLVQVSDIWYYGNTKDGKYTLAVKSDFQSFIEIHFIKKNGDDFATVRNYVEEL